MKKLMMLVLSGLASYYSNAQESDSEKALAKDLVTKNSQQIGLTTADLANSIIANTYNVAGSNVRMIYLQQSFQGIPVFNKLQVLAFRNGTLASKAGERIANLESKVNVGNGLAVVTALDAVRNALASEGLVAKEQIVPASISADGHSYKFGTLGVTVENISAELLWYPLDENAKEVRLAWQVFITPANKSDYWLIRVDAMNGAILGKQNLTITCNWDDKHHDIIEHSQNHNALPAPMNYVGVTNSRYIAYRPFLINTATYRVVPYPYESPLHLGAASALVTDPWLMAAGSNATSLGWHNDGSLDHDSTRGNNVWAAEDRNATNGVIDRAALSSTPSPSLLFDFVPDPSQAPTTTSPPNQQFGITNLFYWNNVMHDISYLYGFDEVSGNFQNSNQGRGGLGSDYVIADAQDGGGTNNANFATPVDGSRPRMQMYLWTAPNPDRDGDVDNSIVAHEYTHGISNRLTGGPGNSSCLGNAEHGGEGWSDYFALMVTTNWATATISDGALGRGIGTYAANQPATGPGIRSFRYSTNIAINPLVYSANLSSESHARGEYWCMALWEMTWEIIQQAGINPNLYNPTTSGGNSVALKLVIEGMRLQPCNPGFIDARNAILKADTLFYGAQYSCAIWRAFAKRGMGRNASQGSSASVTDQVPSFIVDNGIFSVTQSVSQIPEGQQVTYTSHVTAGVCSPLVNAFITDTLPANVTYVSGGIYNPGNRTISFGPINLASLQSQDHSFTVSVNNGSYFTPEEHINESVNSSTIPATWITATSSGTEWTVSTTQGNTAPNSFFAPNPTVLTDHTLATSASFPLNGSSSSYTTLSFWHKFNTEDGWDGGVVEISTDNGASWNDLGSKMIVNRYNGSLGAGSGNILAGRQAFTGNLSSFIKTVINLSSYAGQSIRIRFRFVSDDNTAPAGGGWFVDDILLKTEPAVAIKSNLFNAASVLLSTADTFTRILPSASCTPVSISTQPVSVTACAGNTIAYTVVASGSPTINYQWQVNTGSGFVNVTNAAPYSGATTATLTVTGVSTAMNGYQYRSIVTNSCATVNSAAVGLTVTAVATITTQPANSITCAGNNSSFSVVASGATGYQWQVNTGSGFANIVDAPPYSGSTTATLNINAVTAVMNNYQYRVVLSSCGPALNSNNATLTIADPPAISGQPANVVVCQGASAGFSVIPNGTVTGYQWQVSIDGGSSYTNLNGQTNNNLQLAAVASSQNGYLYRAVVTGNCGSINSTGGMLTVNPRPQFTLGTIPASRCLSDTVVSLTSTGAGGSWSGVGVLGSSFYPSSAGIGNATVSFTSINSFGCTSIQSANIQVNECPDRHRSISQPNALIIYPNPNDGHFQIRIKTDLYTKLYMRVFASDGKLISTRQFTGLYYDRVIPVDFSRLPAGVYHLYVYNDEGSQLVKKTFSLVIAR